MKKKTLKILIRGICCTLTAIMIFSLGVNAFADSFDIVSIGDNLTAEQIETMYKEFGVDKQSVQEIRVNNKEEREALLGFVPEQQIGDKTISCAYVKMREEGAGLSVEVSNLTWVSESMLKNTLITAGINDADVKAGAPFKVSGTGALTGVMKAFETKTETKIPEDKKEAANQELITTGDLGEKIGKDEASLIMNEIKTEVIKDKPKNDIQIGSIVNNIVNNYNINLDEKDKQKIISTMSKINDIGYDYKSLKNTLSDTSNSFKSKLEDAGTKLEESGIISKCVNKIKQFCSWVARECKSFYIWCKGAFTDIEDATIENNGVQYDKNGNIKTEGNIFIEDETRTPEQIKEDLKNEETPTKQDDINNPSTQSIDEDKSTTDNNVKQPNEVNESLIDKASNTGK